MIDLPADRATEALQRLLRAACDTLGEGAAADDGSDSEGDSDDDAGSGGAASAASAEQLQLLRGVRAEVACSLATILVRRSPQRLPALGKQALRWIRRRPRDLGTLRSALHVFALMDA